MIEAESRRQPAEGSWRIGWQGSEEKRIQMANGKWQKANGLRSFVHQIVCHL